MGKTEIWKDVPNYEGKYQVSNLGQVKSLERFVKHRKGGQRLVKERILKPGISNGYKIVGLCKDFTKKTRKVHQLISEAFLNHTPNRHTIVVDHINHNRLDNRLENLQLISNRLNCSKDIKNKTSKYTGIHWCNRDKRWYSKIFINGKRIYLGTFKSEFRAHLAYQSALINFITTEDK